MNERTYNIHRINKLEKVLIPEAIDKLDEISPHDVCELSRSELRFYHLSLEYYERTNGQVFSMRKYLQAKGLLP